VAVLAAAGRRLCGTNSNEHLKVHGREEDLLGFLQKLVPHRSLHYLSSRSDFGLKFAEIFIIEKQLPNLTSRRLSDSASLGVASVSRGVDIQIFYQHLNG
jgi:hypothetical protein